MSIRNVDKLLRILGAHYEFQGDSPAFFSLCAGLSPTFPLLSTY